MPSSVPPLPPQMLLALHLERTPPEPLPVPLAFRWVRRSDRPCAPREVSDFFAADAASFVECGMDAAARMLGGKSTSCLALQCDALFTRPDGRPGREWRGVGPDAWPSDPAAFRAMLAGVAAGVLADAVALLQAPGVSRCAVA